ncbi:hypothetical protein NQ315_016600 [Exocentrus adspersus]|uniref:Elongation of very long chain fatty acids protein n=1 Tax=Exocentrus adspersus TaxID=1586481 RepID=A0AAV8V5Y4_9CUCU|nr:hypothetical protein NQ315_016600 [Exocentrus adspersus]
MPKIGLYFRRSKPNLHKGCDPPRIDADPRTDDFYLVSPLIPLSIGLAYLYFVYSLGPRLMQNRKPFNIANIIRLFNLIQIIANAYVAVQGLKYTLTIMKPCKPIDYTINYGSNLALHVAYGYYLLKIFDLFDTVSIFWYSPTSSIIFAHYPCYVRSSIIDSNERSKWNYNILEDFLKITISGYGAKTVEIDRYPRHCFEVMLYRVIQKEKIIFNVSYSKGRSSLRKHFWTNVFFVLRKSYRQINFLHVYHHFFIVIGVWIGLRYVAGGESLWIGSLNSCVHVVMYLYYLLATFDDKWKSTKYKKILTQLQIIQFLILMIIYFNTVIVSSCQFPKWIGFLLVPQCCFMILLFGDFYIKTYLINKNKK